MDLLVLGGTKFLGRHLVEAALADGHRVTLFNRDLSNPDLFSEVETIGGDREADLSALRGRRWSAAIDLAAWIVKMAADQQTGTYNATGPAYELQMGTLLEECDEAGGGDATFVWVSEEFLEENGVEPFTELPLWVPREYGGMLAVDCGRAIAAGSRFGPSRRR